MEQTTENKPAPAVGKRAKVTGKKRTAARKLGKRAAKRGARAKNQAGGRKDQLLALIGRKDGATLTEIMKAFQWQAHSCRGALSILGKDHKIVSEKVDGVRCYRLK